MSTNPFVLNELAERIGMCSGILYKILENKYMFSSLHKEEEREYALLENCGFLIAHLHHEKGISNDETTKLAAIISAMVHGEEYFKILCKAISFYSKQFFSPTNEIFLNNSIYCYNLSHPRTWNDFKNGIPIEAMNALETISFSVQIMSFLKEEFPKQVNPILERL
ncbi:MAG: hypothetical protein IJU19_00605 [Bacteroidales bacterium]|nr:hypothetical protein [Bacteroidales bacterium]